MEWFSDKHIHLLDWPSYSPDINPMENLWGWMKKKIALRRPKTIQRLETDIIDCWKEISAKHIYNLIDSMPRRCRLLIEGKGEQINY